MKDEVVTVRLSSTTLEAVKYLCKFHDISVAEFVRNSVDDYIANDYTRLNNEAIKRALAEKFRKLEKVSL